VPTPVDIGGLGGTNAVGQTPPPGRPAGSAGPGDGGNGNGGTGGGGPTEPRQTPAPGETTAAAEGPGIAIDTVPEGNDASTLGEIETCASANKGDSFIVDLVIKDVTDLLAFESSIIFNKDVLEVTDRDVEMFLANGEGSRVVDTSEQTPDESARYIAGAVDTADPAEPDSGDGVLVRLTLEAKEDGTSELTLDPSDENGDQKADYGSFLRDVNGDIIGDTNDDTFFDGPAGNAEIRVGEDCPDSDATVLLAEGGEDGSGDGEDDGDGFPVVPVVAGLAVGAAAIGGGAYYFIRRRSGGVA
jgi:hypothetical protein